jgi:hypothetical protein
LALAWVQAGHDVWLHGRRAKPVPVPLTLTSGAAGAAPPWVDRVEVIVCAVPDDAITPLARALSATGAVHADQVVLHLSGSLDHSALESLRSSGAALGSLHPLQTLVEPERTPDHGRSRRRSGWRATSACTRSGCGPSTRRCITPAPSSRRTTSSSWKRSRNSCSSAQA